MATPLPSRRSLLWVVIVIGFAVPARTVGFVVDQILDQGEVRRGRIGVAITETLPPSGNGGPAPPGALIAAVAPGSAAGEAGLQKGDIVIAVNKRPTPTAAALRNEVGLTEVGAQLTLTVQRGKETRELKMRVRG